MLSEWHSSPQLDGRDITVSQVYLEKGICGKKVSAAFLLVLHHVKLIIFKNPMGIPNLPLPVPSQIYLQCFYKDRGLHVLYDII